MECCACGNIIDAGNNYWDFGGETFCEDCVNQAKSTVPDDINEPDGCELAHAEMEERMLRGEATHTW